jgi:hypothetical protein
VENTKCIGSILYSDIGKKYYSKLGWHPNITNSHVVVKPLGATSSLQASHISREDLTALCKADEAMVRKIMASPTQEATRRMTILPDLDHMLWHIQKEEFASNFLFGRVPHAKGAIAGPPGSRVWVVWTHRYYGQPEAESSDNTLYILRLVFENHQPRENIFCENDGLSHDFELKERVDNFQAVLAAARAEAAEWKLDQVMLWDPTKSVQELMRQAEIEHFLVEREEDSIASGFWYNESGDRAEAPRWINNEHYAWC